MQTDNVDKVCPVGCEFKFRQWNANLRILDVTQVKTAPYVPLSHPFVERLIGSIRRVYVDQVPFWSALDLERRTISIELWTRLKYPISFKLLVLFSFSNPTHSLTLRQSSVFSRVSFISASFDGVRTSLAPILRALMHTKSLIYLIYPRNVPSKCRMSLIVRCITLCNADDRYACSQ